jgi:hypothetical protein
LDQTYATADDLAKIDVVRQRIKSSGYKRSNPYNLMHPVETLRYQALEKLDNQLQNREQNITL